jgi:hypothetical protein
MRTMTIVLGLTVLAAAGLEAQAVASPSSRRLPRGSARGTRTEPPPPPEPGQANRPVQPPAGDRFVGGYGPYWYYYYGAYAESPGTYTQQPPPAPLIDARGPQPGPAMAYIPGFWMWTGSSFNWMEGRWVPVPAGYTRWVPGYWTGNQLGHYYVRGYWAY